MFLIHVMLNNAGDFILEKQLATEYTESTERMRDSHDLYGLGVQVPAGMRSNSHKTAHSCWPPLSM